MRVQLTSREAARLLDVHESTVKRWCNAGELRYSTTRGGHRRIELDELMQFARGMRIPAPLLVFHPYEAAVHHAMAQARRRRDFASLSALALEWALGDRPELIEALFRQLGTLPDMSLSLLFDELLGTLMRSVGDAWRAGRIGVGDEHYSTQVVIDALHHLRTTLQMTHQSGVDSESPAPGRRLRPMSAVIACAEGDQHELGAMCVRILLEQRGWRVYYLGANVPIEETAAFQKKQRAELVCISFVPPRAPTDARRTVRLLADMYDSYAPYALGLGGSGLEGADADWGETPFRDLQAFGRLGDFDAWLGEAFAPTE